MLMDGLGRSVSYLRLSVTDRCNLRCTYCVSGPQRFIPHDEVLRYEECTRLIALARGLGVRKVRFTGGEPFARKDFAGFVVRTLEGFPGLDVRITTNATLLGPHIKTLARAGLSCVNISLDTLDRAKYERITGADQFAATRTAIDACLDAGIRVKVNAVAMLGINDDEMPAFVNLARTLPIDFRFIERMPVGEGADCGEVWRADDIVAAAGALATLTPAERNDPDKGPARMFAIEGGQGRIGVITPLTCSFCDNCNRLRVTSDGRLRTCLYSDKSFRLRNILRNPRLGDEHLARVIQAALKSKPKGSELLERRLQGAAVCSTRMHTIGG